MLLRNQMAGFSYRADRVVRMAVVMRSILLLIVATAAFGQIFPPASNNGGQAANGVPATGSGVVCSGSGTARICTAGTDYQAPISTLPVANGGTGSTTASGALTALGGVNSSQVTSGANTASCSTSSANGIFRPECYSDSGSGNSLISQADAAFNAAAAYVPTHGTGSTVLLSTNTYSVCNNQQGWIVPQSTGGAASVNIVGQGGSLGAILNVTCTVSRSALPSWAQSGSPLSQAFLWSPVPTTPALTSVRWANFVVYGNLRCTYVADLEGYFFVSAFEHLGFSGATGDGTALASELRIGNSSYASQSWMFRSTFIDVSAINTGTVGSGAAFTVSNSSGTPSFTVSSQGNNYSSNTVVYVLGAATGSSRPCFTDSGLLTTTSYVPRANVTISGGHITAVSNSGMFCGSGALYAVAYDTGASQVIPYGIVLDHATDNEFYSLEPQTGFDAALLHNTNSGNNRFYGLHPCCGMATGVLELGQGQFNGTEFDSLAAYGIFFSGGAKSVVRDSTFFWNGTYPGSQGYYIGPTIGPKIAGGVCLSAQSAGGYALTGTNNGPNTYNPGAIFENEQECSGLKQVNVSNGIVANAVSTVASATTIALTTQTTHISGTTAIATITAPTTFSTTAGQCYNLIADAAWTTTTAGNIQSAMTAVANTPYQACWGGSKWFIK